MSDDPMVDSEKTTQLCLSLALSVVDVGKLAKHSGETHQAKLKNNLVEWTSAFAQSLCVKDVICHSATRIAIAIALDEVTASTYANTANSNAVIIFMGMIAAAREIDKRSPNLFHLESALACAPRLA
eukprot:1356851-Amphidinium_carterae.2